MVAEGRPPGATASRRGSNLGNAISSTTGFIGKGVSATDDFVRGSGKVAGGVVKKSAKMTGNVVTGGAKMTGNVVKKSAKMTGNVVTGSAKMTGNVVTGTAKMTGRVVTSSAKMTGNVVTGTAKMTGNAVTGTAKMTGNVVTGTAKIGLATTKMGAKLTGDVVLGSAMLAGTAVTGTAKVVGATANAITGAGKAKIAKKTRVAWDSRVTAPHIKLDLVIECRRLPKKDSFSQADAFCGLWEVPNTSFKDKKVSRLPGKQEKEIGRTEVVRENKNPKFTTTFRLEYKFQEEQTYILRVYDEDLRYATDLKEHDFIGGFVFTLGELMGSGGCAIARPLSRGKAFVVLTGREFAETREVLEFRFSGQDLGLLERKHKVVGSKEALEAMQKLNVAKNVLEKFNPFFKLEKLNPEDQSWITVWKSEVIKDNQHPTWNVARLPLQLLCDDDPTSALKITIWAWNRFAPDELVGQVETKVADLVMQGKRGIPVFDVLLEKRRIFGGLTLKKAGTLKVLKSAILNIPSMLQYFAGGCEMDLMIAIDCTKKNGDWRQDDQSLHYRSTAWMNDYQAAIKKVGMIYEAYAGKREFTMWGYGASVKGVYQPHFLIGEKLRGADEMLRTYDETFSAANESLGPSAKGELKSVIHTAMYKAIRSNQERQCYSTLVILSTGEMSDPQETVDAICSAAEDAPLSIVIIGVGITGNFEVMQRFAGGETFGKLRHSNGVPIARDIVHFVKFSNFHGNASKCVSESLKEVPEQFVQHFLNSGQKPSPPKPTPDFGEVRDKTKSSISSERSSGRSRSSRGSASLRQ